MRFLLNTWLVAVCSLCVPAAASVFDTDPEPHPTHPPAIEELTLYSSGQKMPALLYQANGPGPHPTLVLLHGFPGNEKNLDIAQLARRAGFNILFFNYRGAWGAGGAYSVLQLEQDALAALAFLRKPEAASRYRVDKRHLSLLGHSLGGFAALAAGRQDRDVECIGAMSPVNLALWKQGIARGDATGKRILAYADTLFMLQGMSSTSLRDDLSAAVPSKLDTRGFGSGLSGKSVFMVVGDKDPVTTPEAMFKPVVEAYLDTPGMRLQHHVISGDHSFSWSRIELSQLVLDWLERDCR